MIFAATLTLPIASKSAACELEYQRVPGLFRLYTPVEKAEISNTFLPRLEDVCNAEILEFPNLVQWSAQIRPAEDKYSNYRYEECWVGSRNDEFQSFLYNHAWPIIRRCKTLPKTLTLTPAPNQTPPDPRPKGTEGKDPKSSSLDLIAKVMEGSVPKAGVAVTFKVDAVPMTGGHGHHDANRPTGEVTPSGRTDVNGEIKITFQASDVAGSHTITATCNDCTNKTVNKNVDARVPDLQPLSPNPPQNAEGKYLYALTANDPKHVGTSGGRQRGEYYLTAKAIDNLQILVKNFAAENWGVVAFNDASLVWGGLYDIDNDWMESHQGHRLGEEIDISFTRANNPISVEKRKRVYKTLCDDKKVSVPFKILYHIGGAGPHYHVYLLGRKQGCFTLPT